MGDPKDKWPEWTQGLGKILIWVFYILMGAIAKIAVDSRSKALSKKEIAIKFTLSVFTGVLAWRLCAITGRLEFGQVVVPVATLLGEGVVNYIMSNGRQWIASFFNRGKNNDDNNFNDLSK